MANGLLKKLGGLSEEEQAIAQEVEGLPTKERKKTVEIIKTANEASQAQGDTSPSELLKRKLEQKEGLSKGEMVALGLLSIIPAAIGGVAAGAEGAAAGADASGAALGTFTKLREGEINRAQKAVDANREAEAKAALAEQTARERREMKEQELELRRQGLAQSKLLAEMNFVERLDRRNEADIQKVSKVMQPFVAASNRIGQLESALEFDLDDLQFDPKKGVTLNGKPVDVPGVSVVGVGRIAPFWSKRARDIKSTFTSIFNELLAQRSGAAVTEPEFIRLRDEFQQGKFDSEEGMLKGLVRYKNAMRNLATKTRAGFRPEVLQEYESRGGVGEQSWSAPNRQTAVSPDLEAKRLIATDQEKQITRTGRTKDGRKVIEYSDGTREVQ